MIARQVQAQIALAAGTPGIRARTSVDRGFARGVVVAFGLSVPIWAALIYAVVG